MAEATENTQEPASEGTPTPGQQDLFSEQQAERDRKADERQAQLIEELRRLRTAQATPKEEPKPERIYSPEELEKLVEAGQLTQAQMVDYLTRVRTDAAVKEAEKRITEEQRAAQRNAIVAEKVRTYRAAIPELSDKSSAEFKEAAEAYEELVKEGEPENLATELAALRAVFGRDPHKRRGKPEVRETTGERQSSVEAAGSTSGRRSERREAPSSGGLPGWVPAANREFYEKGFKNGLYKGPKDPNLLKELEILKGRIERRNSAA